MEEYRDGAVAARVDVGHLAVFDGDAFSGGACLQLRLRSWRIVRRMTATRNWSAPKSEFQVPFDGTFELATAPTGPPKGAPDEDECRKRLARASEEIADLQRVLYADNRYAVLLIFQAMDAAGKDGTIRAVMAGVDPTGCQVSAFKQPSTRNWTTISCGARPAACPSAGGSGSSIAATTRKCWSCACTPATSTRSGCPVPATPAAELWSRESIRGHESHLARNGTVVLKFWLNVSAKQTRQRFLSRLRQAEKDWKFNPGDVEESETLGRLYARL